jgi:hypothetical protein
MQIQVQRSLKRRQTGVTESGKYCADKFIYMRVRIADKKLSQRHNLIAAAAPVASGPLSTNSEAQKTGINNMPQAIAAENAGLKGDNASQPKKRKPRPTKA